MILQTFHNKSYYSHFTGGNSNLTKISQGDGGVMTWIQVLWIRKPRIFII